MISYDDYQHFKREFECFRSEFFQFKDMVRQLDQRTQIIENDINNIKYQLNTGLPSPIISNELDLLKQDIKDINKQIGIIMNDLDSN